MGRRRSALPERIVQDLLWCILADEFTDVGLLPSERSLQESYGVSRTNLRSLISALYS
jgi:DNA-binding FadR family transcriptional regulator